MIARWRLQLLAEMGIGKALREEAALEDSRYTRLKEATSRP